MIDYILIFSFFLYLIYFSLKSYAEVSSINAFSLGIRAVSTFALGTTILATYISGSGFFLDMTEFYINGLVYLIASIGMCCSLLITGSVIVPKMERFLGKLSIASIMGEEYGQTARFLTAFLGIIKVSGSIYIQFKIMGTVLYYLFPLDHLLSEDLGLNLYIVVSSLIVIAYTYAGGIFSVVHTDKIQAICFSLALIIGIATFNSLDNTTEIIDYSNYYPSNFFSLESYEQWEWISLFLYFLLPSMSPPNIQRISMGFSIKQVKNAYNYSALGSFIVLLLSCYLAYLLYSSNPSLTNEQIIPELFNKFTIPGAKAILAIGVISMCMSTADSNLNISAVLMGNDLWKFGKADPFERLRIARLSTIIIGLLSLVFIFFKFKLLDILLLSGHFYMPTITVPVLLIIFGFKTTERCLLIAIALAFTYVLLMKYMLGLKFNIIPSAMAVNFVTLICSHFIIEKWNMLESFGVKSKLKKAK